MNKVLAKSNDAKVAANNTPVEPGQGEHMITFSVRFFTNGLAGKKGEVLPKNAWTSGNIQIDTNSAHGIKAGDPTMFHSLMEIPSVIEQIIIEKGVVLHLDRSMKKYIK